MTDKIKETHLGVRFRTDRVEVSWDGEEGVDVNLVDQEDPEVFRDETGFYSVELEDMRDLATIFSRIADRMEATND